MLQSDLGFKIGMTSLPVPATTSDRTLETADELDSTVTDVSTYPMQRLS